MQTREVRRHAALWPAASFAKTVAAPDSAADPIDIRAASPLARPHPRSLDETGGSYVCEAPVDESCPTQWYELTVPAGVSEVEIEAVGSGATHDEAGLRPAEAVGRGLGAVDLASFGTRVRATVPARPGERLSIRTSAHPSADGGSEVTFASDWADRWVFASGGERRGTSWGPVDAVIDERVHPGPGRVTIRWRHDPPGGVARRARR